MYQRIIVIRPNPLAVSGYINLKIRLEMPQ